MTPTLSGIALKVGSTLFFSGMVAIVKTYASAYPVAEIVFFRSFFAILVLIAWLWTRREFPSALQTKWFSGHLHRSVAGTASLMFSFTAFGMLPLADATAIGYAGPLFIVAFAGLMLKERVGPARWGAVALGSTGVLLMLWDHLGVSQTETSRGAIGAVCALMSAVFVAIAMIQTRRLVRTEHMGAVIFYFQATASAFAALLMVAGTVWPGSGVVAEVMRSQAWTSPTLADWGPLIAAGLLGGFGQILMTSSYKLADASIIACFDYTSMIWALILGSLFFSEAPTPIVLTGASIVAAAGILVILSERQWRRIR